jgi:hypothetical protein
MVRMLHLTKRLNHASAAGTTPFSLLCERPRTAAPLLCKPLRTPRPNRTGGTPQRRWETVSPTRIIPPSPQTQRYHQSTKQHIILIRPKLKQSSIQWLLLRHRFLTAHAMLYPQPTNPQSYHQNNETALATGRKNCSRAVLPCGSNSRYDTHM